MKLWFMFDNHTFSLVEGDRRQRLLELFACEGAGVIFARNADGCTIESLHGRRLASGRYGVTGEEIDAFLARIDEFENWECR